MLNRFAVWLTNWTLKRSSLTLAQRNSIVIHILDTLEALPLRDIISSSDEGILVNGKQVTLDKLQVLRDAATAALDNQAFNYIGEQVVWVALQRGIHNGTTPESLYFYRAAIWFGEQMKAHLQILAQQNLELPD